MNMHTLSSQSPWKKILAFGVMTLLSLGAAFVLVGCSNNDAFFALDSEFNQLETELDTYENQKEAEYRNGSLSWEQYRTLELQLEQIEDRLDNAQDSLELRFGVDD